MNARQRVGSQVSEQTNSRDISTSPINFCPSPSRVLITSTSDTANMSQHEQQRVQPDADRFPLPVLGLDRVLHEYDAGGSMRLASLSREIARWQGVPVDDQVLTIRGTAVAYQPSLFTQPVTLSFVSLTAL